MCQLRSPASRPGFVLALLVPLACGGTEGTRLARGGSLDLRAHPGEGELVPPVELLLIDPLGRRTGVDPGTNETLQEIPGSSYTAESIADDVSGAPGPQTKIIDVRNPPGGEYRLRVIGLRSRVYHLQVTAHDRELNPSSVEFTNVNIDALGEHVYVIRYRPEPGSRVDVRRGAE